jgi:glutamyl-tRNA synthetase
MIQRLLNIFRNGKRINGSKVVTRFAPSPTGLFHAGSYRTAVFSYLYAKKYGGKFILRIEDTDRARSTKEYEDNIIESLKWLHLDYDELYRQSERGEIYRKYLEKLLADGTAYISKEEQKEEGDRAEVIRFRNLGKKVRFDDIIRGLIEFDTTELGDFIIAKSVDEPVFHFAVVLDDYLMGVTHVIRGEDHISNTPRQILIQEALGAPTPTYGHLPLVLAADRSKLSKRHGAKPMTFYRDQGFIPEALLNYMSLIGWNPGTEKEIFSLPELITEFDIARVQKGGASFSEEKLLWVNKEHLKRVPQDLFALEARKYIGMSKKVQERSWNITEAMLIRLVPTLLDRINTYFDITKMIDDGEVDYLFIAPKYDALSLKWKAEKDLIKTLEHLAYIKKALGEVKDSKWTEEGIKEAVWTYADAEGRGTVLWPYRFALSGRDKSPNPFSLSYILGKEETLARLETAWKLCENHAHLHP